MVCDTDRTELSLIRPLYEFRGRTKSIRRSRVQVEVDQGLNMSKIDACGRARQENCRIIDPQTLARRTRF